MSEADLYKTIPLAVSNGDTRLWRANAGLAYAGTAIEQNPRRIVLQPYRRIRLGPAGFPDLFGFKAVTITPDMVGRRLAVFVGIEAKSATGRLSDDQQSFLSMLHSLGALQGVAKSVEDAREILDGITCR